MADGEWLRARGMGRERFAGYFADYLTGLGYVVEKSESAEPPETRIHATLTKMNPSVPAIARSIELRLVPTSAGSSASWVAPSEVPQDQRERLDRLVREMVAQLERSILTESHAAAKLSKAPDARLPWQGGAPPGASSTPPS